MRDVEGRGRIETDRLHEGEHCCVLPVHDGIHQRRDTWKKCQSQSLHRVRVLSGKTVVPPHCVA